MEQAAHNSTGSCVLGNCSNLLLDLRTLAGLEADIPVIQKAAQEVADRLVAPGERA